jgi:hypothetical protein
LKAEVATLKAENAALRRDCQSLCDKVQALEEAVTICVITLQIKICEKRI